MQGCSCRELHKDMELEPGGLNFGGLHSRKSIVLCGMACLSMETQSGFGPLKYTVEIWASCAA